jgi:hypothetical protein
VSHPPITPPSCTEAIAKPNINGDIHGNVFLNDAVANENAVKSYASIHNDARARTTIYLAEIF